jgi:hypothetical protein
MKVVKVFNALDFFTWSIKRSSRLMLTATLLLMVALVGLKNFEKETSVDSFIPPDHPSVLARQQVKDTFGLNDPIVIALDTGINDGIFEAEALNTIAQLEKMLWEIPAFRQDRISSILSEKSMSGDGFSLAVDDIGQDTPYTQNDANRVKEMVRNMPLFNGVLISENGRSAIITAELRNQKEASNAYITVMENLPKDINTDYAIHVAGTGAVAGYLSQYIDMDGRKMQPLAFLIILIILYFSFRDIKTLLAPISVIFGAVLGTIGLMSWAGVYYYPITSALPVVILAIAVADSIHVLSSYFEVLTKQPTIERKDAVIKAMSDIWVPITLTTITTMAGFIGLAVASIMPPIKYFGLFAAVGVFLAWALTLFVLPAIILKLKLSPTPKMRTRLSKNSIVVTNLYKLSLFSATFPLRALCLVILCIGVSSYGASLLKVDRHLINNFSKNEVIYKADAFISENFAGTSYLDVMIESDEEEGLFSTATMQQVKALQDFLEGQDGVGKTLSLVDYYEKLHISIDPDSNETLPLTDDAFAQYMLLYESSSDPEDFQEEIDSSYQTMLVRAYIKSGFYSRDKIIVNNLENYVADSFKDSTLKVTIGGRVNVDYHWMDTLKNNHFESVIITLILILIMAAILFKSLRNGLVTIIPVMLTVLGIYALMGWLSIYLEPATSMFASIAIGIGVDFAIHLIDRVKLGLAEGAPTVIKAIQLKFSTPLRACYFNAIALSLGFATLMSSELMPLQNFGLLVSFAALASFLAALIVVPMAWALMAPNLILITNNK